MDNNEQQRSPTIEFENMVHSHWHIHNIMIEQNDDNMGNIVKLSENCRYVFFFISTHPNFGIYNRKFSLPTGSLPHVNMVQVFNAHPPLEYESGSTFKHTFAKFLLTVDNLGL